MTGPEIRTPHPVELTHGWSEDVLGLLVGTGLVSLGLCLLHTASLVTGGTAGLALLLTAVLPVPFGIVFAAVNAPFFLLAVRGRGWNFAVRSTVAIVGVSLLVEAHGSIGGLAEASPPPAYAAIVGNVLCGVGLIVLFRHGASLGGFTIVALLMQDAWGLRAGYVLMGLDTLIVLASLWRSDPITVAISAAGVVVLNLVLAYNHRPGRYTGTSRPLSAPRRTPPLDAQT